MNQQVWIPYQKLEHQFPEDQIYTVKTVQGDILVLCQIVPRFDPIHRGKNEELVPVLKTEPV